MSDLCLCRDAYIASDIRAIAAGPLFYPLSLNRCQEIEFENEHPLLQYKASSPAEHFDDSSSAAVADFLVERKLCQTGATTRIYFLILSVYNVC